MFFTYADPPDPFSLYQGDLLARTSALDAVLKEIHPYYLKPDYRFFIVLTQSCDLQRRGGESCKASYITLAAVRPVARAIERFTQRLLRDIEWRLAFGSNDREARVRQFVERLLNNNEPEHFYLHDAPGTPLNEDHCAFLQLSIAVKVQLHYETVLAAKILQLTESFEHKLGYLVGTSYARVATEDWVPRHASQETFDSIVAEHVEGTGVTWLERNLHNRVLKRLSDLPESEQTMSALESAIAEERRTREQRKKEILNAVQRVAKDAGLDDNSVQKLTSRLGDDPVFMSRI